MSDNLKSVKQPALQILIEPNERLRPSFPEENFFEVFATELCSVDISRECSAKNVCFLGVPGESKMGGRCLLPCSI